MEGMMERRNKSITMLAIFVALIIIFISVPLWASMNLLTEDCKTDPMDGVEQGEKIFYCTNRIVYTHDLYDFSVVIPRDKQVHIVVNERKPEELGKIVSIAFAFKEAGDAYAQSMLHLLLKKSDSSEIGKELATIIEHIDMKSGFSLEKTIVDNLEAWKCSSELKSCYIIIKEGINYVISFSNFSSVDSGAYNENKDVFERIMQTVQIIH